jgi:ATP synthase protein I
MNQDELERLRAGLRRAHRRRERHTRERPTVLAQTAFLGTLGLLLVLPIVAGAYLGEWLDRRMRGYSVSWTLTFLILGVAVGAFNVYLFIRERS